MNIKIKIGICSLSIFALAGLSLFSNLQNGTNIMYSVCIMLITLISAVYSFIPLIRDLILEINREKNYLSSDLFTDREEDLTHLLEMLSSPGQKIEIKGTDEERCGKSWLAKRLCDCINKPKAEVFKNINIKNKFKRAFYLDMNKCSDEKLEKFFSKNVIRSRDVLIFDNVENFEQIINKQRIFHFQMVYILKKNKAIDFSTHYVSNFDVEHMVELHKKLRCRYPRLEKLTKKEFDKLFMLTNGNIGRISDILGEQKCITWLKKIADGRPTEYDLELDKIQIYLFQGDYKKAKNELLKFDCKYKAERMNMLDLNYKYTLMKSDCEHLLNNYENALDILSTLNVREYQPYNKKHEIELHHAHYCKHLWQCDCALSILHGIKNDSYSAIVDSLGILAAKYFIDDLHVEFSDKNSIEQYKAYYVIAKNSTMLHTDDDTYNTDTCKVLRHKAIYEFYKDENIDIEILLNSINKVIEIYKAENNRLLANAYFIQGEIYRLHHKYDEANISYKNTLSITYDNNIIIQVNLMVYYLKKIKKVQMDFDMINNEQINALCETNNYAKLVYRRIKCIERKDDNMDRVKKCFDTRIMPIL